MDHALHLLSPCWNLWSGCIVQKTCIGWETVCIMGTSHCSVHSFECQRRAKDRNSFPKKHRSHNDSIFICTIYQVLLAGSHSSSMETLEKKMRRAVILCCWSLTFSFARKIIRPHFKQSCVCQAVYDYW